MIRLRGGSGLGDSIYLRPLAEHFARAGEEVTVMSNYADVFIGTGAQVQPFTRLGVNVVAHYTLGKNNPNTNQWEDVCKAARVQPTHAFRTHWDITDQQLADGVLGLAEGKPVVLVHAGRAPMARTDGFGAELLPQREAVQAAIDEVHRCGCYTVAVGKQDSGYPLSTDLDLVGTTSVAQLFDLMSVAEGALGQVSFLVPLAEVLGKHLLCVWAVAGLKSSTPYIQTITPKKIFARPHSMYAMDDATPDQICSIAKLWANQLHHNVSGRLAAYEAACAS